MAFLIGSCFDVKMGSIATTDFIHRRPNRPTIRWYHQSILYKWSLLSNLLHNTILDHPRGIFPNTYSNILQTFRDASFMIFLWNIDAFFSTEICIYFGAFIAAVFRVWKGRTEKVKWLGIESNQRYKRPLLQKSRSSPKVVLLDQRLPFGFIGDFFFSKTGRSNR